MQYEETYLVTLTAPDGKITSESFDDVAEALDAYERGQSRLAKGAKIELRRYSSVMLASAAKAR
ncbi:hypothetical protein ACFRNT_11285 [Streptomyces sp. NPDC056697]|uniref:hypothetical protein n=1 Tax=Streptomyces sp. NPDC056697 TaxID=3345915 RepID=UPI0036CBB3E8